MAQITCTNEQLRLIQNALDFYSRMNIGQFTEIKNLPTFENNLVEICRPSKDPEVGDSTPQGKILEILDDKALINGSIKDGAWNKEPGWINLSDVRLSTNYGTYHAIREDVDNLLTQARNVLIQDHSVGTNGSWGIYNTKVDETAREAFNLVQVIRHEFWKEKPNKNQHTVDSSVDSWMKNKIEVTLD